MATPEFPPISISRFDVNPHPADRSVYEVQPFADRHPYGDWAAAFYLAAEAAEDIQWPGNGAAHCAEGDVERVKARLREIAEDTNQRLSMYFAKAIQVPGQREHVERLLALEGSAAASVAPDDAYWIKFP